jgi:outer membrane biosynthesis protein TonB
MRAFAISAVFLLLVIPRVGVAQPPSTDESKYYVKRCRPRMVHKNTVAKPKTIQARKGEKATGYPPVIAFEILESGEVAKARVKRSSGIADIDTYALNSIRGKKYNSRPGCGIVESEATVLIHF